MRPKGRDTRRTVIEKGCDMAKDVIDPFNSDVDAYGRYEYTDPQRRSSKYSNRRCSDATLASLACDGDAGP